MAGNTLDPNKVAEMVDAVVDYARHLDMTYGELRAAIERLHLFVLMRMTGCNEHEVADYLEAYGAHIAMLIRNGAIEIGVAPPPTVH